MVGDERLIAVRLIYTLTDKRTGEKVDLDYRVYLETTPLPWGGVRYWFSCPLVTNGLRCTRRVGCLYLPPGGRYFGCRHCYNLTYTSSQEQHQFDGFYQSMALAMHNNYPGMTAADMRYLLESEQEAGKRRPHKDRPPEGFYRRIWRGDPFNFPDPYEHYLTAAQLCEGNGLTSHDLAALEAARLLVPDHDGKYRPKLAGWAAKLAYLLAEGWEIAEIKAWARGRFYTDNPREWPPDRDRWREQSGT